MNTQPSRSNPSDALGQEKYGQDEGLAHPPPTGNVHARRIAEVSPEGIPGDPETDLRTVGRIFTVAFVIVLAISVLLAIFVNMWVGLISAIIGVLLLLVNPVLWAAFSRMKERENL